jgi:hypothetical protein
MFLDNDKKVICLSVPKTGTTTCSHFFSKNINFKHGSYSRIKHLTLNQLIEQKLLRYSLDEYLIYGLVRCPIEKFISGLNHVYVHGRFGDLTAKNFLEFIDNYYSDLQKLKNIDNHYDEMLREQIFWLNDSHIKIYRYENLDLFAKSICELYDIKFSKFFEFGRLNVGRVSVSVDDLRPEIKNKILEIYKEDKELYDKTAIINS